MTIEEDTLRCKTKDIIYHPEIEYLEMKCEQRDIKDLIRILKHKDTINVIFCKSSKKLDDTTNIKYITTSGVEMQFKI